MGRLNSLKIVEAQLTNKVHFYCEKLYSNECLQILWIQILPVPMALPIPIAIWYRSPTS